MELRDRDRCGGLIGIAAIEELGELVRIREQTKRILVGAAALLFIIAAIVKVFAPPGQETISTVFGAVLIIFALGAVIAAALQFRSPVILLKASQPTDDSPE